MTKKLLLSAVCVAAQIGVGSAIAQIKILTPNSDSCAAFVKALDENEQPLLGALGGWAIGYLSGVAQGTGIDFLRNIKPPNTEVFLRIYAECRKRPSQLMSVVLEALSRQMIAERQSPR